jgi:5'(3')-deoxyribonucleotidase
LIKVKVLFASHKEYINAAMRNDFTIEKFPLRLFEQCSGNKIMWDADYLLSDQRYWTEEYEYAPHEHSKDLRQSYV